MAHLPGHKYIGPGTSNLRAIPVDEDDEVAQLHDLQYSQASNPSDVREADEDAFVGFLNVGGVHGHIGALGIGAKYAAESVIGVQYGKWLMLDAYDGSHFSSISHQPLTGMAPVKTKKIQPGQRVLDTRGGHLGLGTAAPGNRREPTTTTTDSGPQPALHNNYAINLSDEQRERARMSFEAARKRRSEAEQRDTKRQAVEDIPDDFFDEGELDEPVQDPGISSAGGEAMAMPQAGGSVPGGTGSSVNPITITQQREDTNSLTFKKTFQVYTAGFQFGKQTESFWTTPNFDWSQLLGSGGTSDPNLQVLTTPLAVVNPSACQWFMSNREWDSLPPGAYATHCSIKVTPLGYRLPFATNEATSTFANSQTLVQIVSGVGINNQMDCMINQYTTDPSDLSKPTGQQGVTRDYLQKLLYGSDIDIGSNMGIPRHLNMYLTLIHSHDQATPNLLPLVNIRNINDTKGTPSINYDYSYKMGVLKAPSRAHYSALLQNNVVLREGNNPMGWWARNLLQNVDTLPTGRGLSMWAEDGAKENNTSQQIGFDFAYQTRIEKADVMTRNMNDRASPDAPPLITFGCMPVQSNAALAPTATFADVVVQWQIETTLHVNYHLNYLDPVIDIFYIQSWDPSAGILSWNNGQEDGAGIEAYIANRRWVGNTPYRLPVIGGSGPSVYQPQPLPKRKQL